MPTFAIDQAADTVTITGTLAWTDLDPNDFVTLRMFQSTYTITIPLTGSPFDPGFTSPGPIQGGNGTLQLPGTADAVAQDPKFAADLVNRDPDTATDIAYGLYDVPSVASGFSAQGIILADFFGLHDANGLDGDQTYTVVVGMNEDYTAVENVGIFLRIRNPIRNTDIIVEEFYNGIDPAPGGSQSVDQIRAINGIFDAPTADNDVVDLALAEVDVTVDGLGGSDRITTGEGNDSVLGGSGRDTLEAGAGNDTVNGQFSNDWVYGGDGNDSLEGGGGADTVEGGAGNDQIQGGDKRDVLDGGSGGDTIGGDRGDDSILGAGGWDTLRGAAGLDAIYGGAGNDVLYGGVARDTLHGDDGNDTVTGGNGNDALFGGLGDDTIFGGKGADRIDGGAGDDDLTGGPSADTFLFAANGGADTVTDFKRGIDMLELSAGLWTGVLTAEQVVDTFATVANGSVRFDFDGAESLVLTGVATTNGLAGDIDIV